MVVTVREAAPPVATRSRGRRLLPHVLVAGVVSAGTARLWAVDPHRPGHYPVCPTFALAGIYCPGCGLLRATHDLVHLDPMGAMQRNPLAIPLYLGAVVLFALWVRASWQGSGLRWEPPRWFAGALALSFVAFTIARHIPGWTLLSPA